MNNSKSEYKKAPLYRQLLAMLYDSLLILAILFIAMGILIAFNSGEAINQTNSPFYQIYLLMIIFFFYGWFWHKSGQTLGMKVWKVKIIHESGYLPSWIHCYTRLAFALVSIAVFGLGYWWTLFFGYTWHDKISSTLILDLRPERNKEG